LHFHIHGQKTGVIKVSRLKELLAAFLRAVTRSKVSLFGSVMVSIIFPVLLISTILDTQGVIQNPYFSFLIYLVMAPLFLLGVILTFLGLFFFKGSEDIGLFTYEYLKEQFNMPGRFTRIRKLIYFISFLAVFFLFVVGLVSYTGFRYTDSVSFCGQFCHEVMEPEFISYKNSPHSRVSCVQCHIGKKARWFTKAKLSGIRQFYAVMTDTYQRPIQTPIGALRPNRETCEECHRPEMFHGDKLYIIDKFLPDELNTHVQTALLMKVGSGGYGGRKAHGIHWHVAEKHQVYYTAVDKGRESISSVVLIDADGTRTEYTNTKFPTNKGSEQRLMDCIDCHNRPTHIYLSPSEALDQKLLTGEIPPQLPFIKKQALEVINQQYGSVQEAHDQIFSNLHNWYSKHYPQILNDNPALLDQAVQGVQKAYSDNVFPTMHIGWDTYPDFIGHRKGNGCFRCHDGSHVTNSGKTISKACDTCHIILVEDRPATDILQLLTAPK